MRAADCLLHAPAVPTPSHGSFHRADARVLLPTRELQQDPITSGPAYVFPLRLLARPTAHLTEREKEQIDG